MMSPSPTNSDAEDVMFEDMPLLNKDSSGSSGIDVNTDEDMFWFPGEINQLSIFWNLKTSVRKRSFGGFETEWENGEWTI